MTTLPPSGNYQLNSFPLYGKLVTNRKPLIPEFVGSSDNVFWKFTAWLVSEWQSDQLRQLLVLYLCHVFLCNFTIVYHSCRCVIEENKNFHDNCFSRDDLDSDLNFLRSRKRASCSYYLRTRDLLPVFFMIWVLAVFLIQFWFLFALPCLTSEQKF